MPNSFFLGLDLGQSADYSALAIIEAQGSDRQAAGLHCRHLQRWPLKTPYPVIVDDTIKLVSRLASPRTPVLAVDATGVGAPVVDLFRKGFRDAPRVAVSLQAIQITGGDQVTRDHYLTRVPKRDLVSVAQVAFQTGRLRIARELAEADTLTRELMNFQVKISLETAHDSYGAWREGAHDDLVLAVCLALWVAHHGRIRVLTAW